MKTPSVLRVAALFVLLAAIVSMVVWLPIKDELNAVLEEVESWGPWGPVLLGLAYILACVLFVPGSILSLAAGFLFGVPVAAVTISLASTTGATCAFLLGRTLLREWIIVRFARNDRFRRLDEAVGREGFKLVLLTRLSPAFPFNALNYAFGLTKVSLRDYVLASWLGMLPGTIMYVYLGSSLKSLADLFAERGEKQPGERILFGLGLAVTVVVTIFVTRLARRALRQAVPAEHDAGTPTK